MLDIFTLTLLLFAGICAGISNAIAGDGTFFTFPVFLGAGLPPVVANASNSIAVWPGHALAVPGYRRELRCHAHHIKAMLVIFERGDPRLHRAISDWLGIEVIRDIYYARVWRGLPDRHQDVFNLLVAHTYRNDPYLADIVSLDPDRPIAADQSRHPYRTHHGFGLLGPVLENMQSVAESLDCEQLTLFASTRDHVGLFERHGFRVEDSVVGRNTLKSGRGIPMERDAGG